MNTNEAQRELKHYEYRVKPTPEYCSPIEEGWELVDVFLKWLDNGHLNYLLVFRKQIPRENIGVVSPDLNKKWREELKK